MSTEELRNKQRESLNLELQRIEKQSKNKVMYLVIGIISISGSLAFVNSTLGFDCAAGLKLFGSIAVCIIVGTLIGCILVTSIKLYFHSNESMVRRQLFDFEMDCIQNEVKEDIFENSIKMSYKYLDEYYSQTREQAKNGFKVSLYVAICGAGLIAIGVVAMFLGHTAPSYITCASGAITELVSVVFFYLYNKTALSMGNYHNKLVLSQNVSIALKVAESLPENEKVSAKTKIINELLKDINAHLVKEDAEDKTKAP